MIYIYIYDIYIYIYKQYRMHAVRPAVVQTEWHLILARLGCIAARQAGVSFWFLLPLSNTAGSSCRQGHQSYATLQPCHGRSGQGTSLSPGGSVREGGFASTSNLEGLCYMIYAVNHMCSHG